MVRKGKMPYKNRAICHWLALPAVYRLPGITLQQKLAGCYKSTACAPVYLPLLIISAAISPM